MCAQELASKRNSINSILSDQPSLKSFQDFIENHAPPYKSQFSSLATSYLAPYVLFPRIICEDTESCADVEWKFTNVEPVIEETFALQEKARRSLGPSLRAPFLIPSQKWIINDLKHRKKFHNEAERLRYLYDKARQFVQVSKALDFDTAYPKPDPGVLRKTYSGTHQRAGELVREGGGGDLGPIFSANELQQHKTSLLEDIETKEVFASYKPSSNEVSDEDLENWRRWSENLQSVLGEPSQLSLPQAELVHWQHKALKTKDIKIKPGKKRFWKRNVYPPMTLEDKIAAKRKLLPPLKPEHLQTDRLSGIWEAELMLDEFQITPYNYDSRLEDIDGPRPIPWWTAHEATQKCWKWLRSNPDNL